MKIHFSKTSCFEVHLHVLIVIHFVHDYEACFVFTQQVHII
nr:MAG TPA: hypothetical protein [Caudoviricetes sp.]